MMETKKVLLVETSLADIDNLVDFFDDYEDFKYFRYDKFYSCMDTRLYLKNNINDVDFFENFMWTIVLKKTNKPIGVISLRGTDKYENRTHLAYFLKKEYRKKGYMTSSIKLVADFAFNKLKLHKIKASVVEDNVDSRKILENLGFQLEGVLKDEVTLEKNYYNTCIYSLINKNN